MRLGVKMEEESSVGWIKLKSLFSLKNWFYKTEYLEQIKIDSDGRIEEFVVTADNVASQYCMYSIRDINLLSV